MLILTRRPYETIIVGDEVFITLLGWKGPQARIGIDAPGMLSVHRLEIYNRLREEQGLPPVTHREARRMQETCIPNSMPNERQVKVYRSHD